MRTICDIVLDLISPRRGPQLLSEEAAIRDLYFSDRRDDSALVERLLWCEGIEPPAPEKLRLRADRLATCNVSPLLALQVIEDVRRARQDPGRRGSGCQHHHRFPGLRRFSS